MRETPDLKALADKVLARDTRRDGAETRASHSHETEPGRLRLAYVNLAVSERDRLDREARGGDRLARVVLRLVRSSEADADA